MGRKVAGTVNADIAIGFVYDAVYYTAGDFSTSFGQAGSDVTGIRARQEVTTWRRYQRSISVAASGTGTVAEGWTLSSHHTLRENLFTPL